MSILEDVIINSMHKNSDLYLLISLIIFSCSSLRNPAPSEKIFVNFSSDLEEDFCTFYINDSLVFKGQAIKTDRSLGVDLQRGVAFIPHKNLLDFRVLFKGDVISDGDMSHYREVKTDTTINLKNGRYILIHAEVDEVQLFQQKKKFILN